MRFTSLSRALVPLSVVALAGCGDGEVSSPGSSLEAREIAFEARVGGSPFACSERFSPLGTSETGADPLDFRLFVHDVALVREGGKEVPFELDEDDAFQRDGVALLDFEDGTGTCNTGSSATNTVLRGQAPNYDDYTGVAFTIGVPERLNHLDAATAPTPFNAPGMWWSWQGGFKYMKIDLASEANPEGFFFHLGATACSGTPNSGFSCEYENFARVKLEASSPDEVVLDTGALYENVDLEQVVDNETDFIAGCMAFPGDPECPAMFEALGLGFEGADAPSVEQALFSLK
jgi:uncharacterized repeat protein (TIGR04052 family)